MQTLWQDLRYALRQLRRTQGFTLTAVLTLSLTVGLAAAVFSVFDALLIRPLPFSEPDRIVMPMPGSASVEMQPASSPEYRFWRENNHSLSVLAGFSTQTMNFRGPAGPVAVRAVHTTDNFFAAFGVQPLLGRTFLPNETARGRNDVAVLSYSLWQKNFGGHRDVIGAKVDLDGWPMTVIGVMPAGFRFPLQSSDAAYAPFRMAADLEASNGTHWMSTIARLKPGVSLASAEADMTRVLADYARIHPDSQGRRMRLIPISTALLGQTSGLVRVLALAVLAVLMLGCVNIAGLMLVRGLRRERELALRLAIGASRARLGRQIFAEIVILAVLGTCGGAAAASVLLHAIRTLLVASLARGSEVALNLPVLAISLGAALFTLVVAGLLPVRQLLSVAPAQALRSGGAGTGTSRGQRRLGAAFIATQMALAMVLLVTSGLLLRSLATLRSTDLGFRTDHLLVEDVNISPGAIVGHDLLHTFYEPLLEQVQAIPGVQSAGIISLLPIQDYRMNSDVQILGQPPAPKDREVLAELRFVTSSYYKSTGVRLLHGRLLDERIDTSTSQPVIVVNEAFTKKFFADGEEPIGRHTTGNNKAMIVGVISDQRQNLYEKPRAEMDLPIAQISMPERNNYLQEMQLVVHTNVDPLTIADPLRHVMQKLDPGLPFRPAETMANIVGEALVLERLESWLFGTFAALAVLLAALGLYGLIAQQVEQGRRDIGIRMALGAQRWQVLLYWMRRVAAISLLGLCSGLVLSFAMRKVIASVLTVRTQHEAFYVAALVVGMELLALLAAAGPARRAASVDPIQVLRAE